MGMRKNRHAQSKQEVINREMKRRHDADSQEDANTKMLRIGNTSMQAMEAAKQMMREKNRKERRENVTE